MKKSIKPKKKSASLNKEIAEILKEAEIWKAKYYALLEKHTAFLNEEGKRKKGSK